MWHSSFMKVPKEEHVVPEANFSKLVSTSKDASTMKEIDVMDELEGFLGIKDDDFDDDDNNKLSGSSNFSQLTWDFMDLDEFSNKQVGDNYYYEDQEEQKEHPLIETSESFVGEHDYYGNMLNFLGPWDDDDHKGMSLNLNLNYQKVMDAWSDRGSFWADEYSLSVASNGYYNGEVPIMEEEKTRREASVLRYKEKRQMRLFSKKIRYQVRKLNADKRPRLKGRFVKRVS